jgi:hypothetical protein
LDDTRSERQARANNPTTQFVRFDYYKPTASRRIEKPFQFSGLVSARIN